MLAPKGLDQTTGTAAILRLPEVRELVTSDFVVLPCDLVCELAGEKLLQAWMVKAASLPDLLQQQDLGRNYLIGTMATGDGCEPGGSGSGSCNGYGAHSGGLCVWYDTRTGIPAVKSEEKDFVATVPLPRQGSQASASSTDAWSASASLLPHLERVVTSMPTDSLNDLTEERGSYPTRHGLIRKHRALRMRTTHRDAHIYIFPHWVMDFVNANEHMDSIGEDVVGWWAKAEWQKSLPEKLGVGSALAAYSTHASSRAHSQQQHGVAHGGSSSSSSGATSTPPIPKAAAGSGGEAARSGTSSESTAATVAAATAAAAGDAPRKQQQMPPILAYVHPSVAAAPLIRRVDTSQLLLTVSLQLAKLPSVEELGAQPGAAAASPFAHTKKVAYPEGVKPRTTITRADSLVAENVTVEEKVSIKECVVGANCQIHEGAKLLQCLLMEGVVVGKGARLTRCILGKRSEIGAQSVLTDCEVQENLLVEPKSESPVPSLHVFFCFFFRSFPRSLFPS